MGLFSMLGRFLFAFFFIFSAGQTMFKIMNDVRVGEDFVTQVPDRLMNFVDNYLTVTSTRKLRLVVWFVFSAMVLKGVGGFLFLFCNQIANQIGAFQLTLYFMLATPVAYDFYHYKVGDPKFNLLLHGFMQDMALFGALIFLMKMRMRMYRRQLRKKTSKSKKH